MRMTLLLLGLLLAVGCGKKADPPTKDSPDSTPGPAPKNETKSDEDLAQGYWNLVAIDHPDGDKPPLEELNKFWFTVKGNYLTVQNPRRLQHFTFKADPTKSPKEVDFFEADSTGKALPILDRNNVKKGDRLEGPFGEQFRGIYKIDGDTITVAIVVDGGAPGVRPKEFKSTPRDPAIAVLTVKKSTQAPPKFEPKMPKFEQKKPDLPLAPPPQKK